jgi:pentatricopeptide repeat protein
MSASGGSVRRELTALLSALGNARRHANPTHAAQLHARLIVSAPPDPHPVLLTKLVSLYAAAGRLADALRAFRAHIATATANLRTYAVLISALARPHPNLAFSLFSDAYHVLRPSPHLVSAVLAACAAGLPTLCGRQVHACASKVVPPHDVFVYTGLVDVYAKAGDMAASRKVFDEMPSRSAASWNALLVGYARNKMCLEALSVFRGLAGQGPEVPMDEVSVSGVLSACSWAGHVDFGRQVHARAAKVGLEMGAVCVSNSLLDMYTRRGCSREALVLFNAMDCRDVITWNIVICACIHASRFKEACMLFQSMVRDGVVADDVSFATGLQASACMLSWALGASIHASVIKTGFLDSDGIAISLITMYSKCGSLDDAFRAFQLAKDCLCVMSWTAMITALQQNGHGVRAVDMFEKMLENGIPPDHITFVSVLSSCSHSGLVEQGRKYFKSMTQVHNITPSTEHYACMVDMFGRAGLLSEAKQFVDQMKVKPDASVLGALLSACMNCKDLEIAEEVAKKLFVIEPGNSGNYALLANIYTSHGRLEEAKEVRRWMMFQELRKEKGHSLVNNVSQISML